MPRGPFTLSELHSLAVRQGGAGCQQDVCVGGGCHYHTGKTERKRHNDPMRKAKVIARRKAQGR